MKKSFLGSAFLLLCAMLFLNSCKTKQSEEEKTLATDTLAIAHGELIFNQHCMSCHNFKTDGIGPHLGGLTSEMSVEWIKKFVKDPKAVIDMGDERAQRTFERYKALMPSFGHLKEEELDDLIAFISTKKSPNKRKKVDDPNALKNPIPEPIQMSNLVIGLEEISQIPPSSTEGQLTRICKFDFRPDTKEIFIVDLRGKLYQLKDNKPSLYLDMVKEKPNFIPKPGLATGFGSFAFHPDFKNNGLLYTTHTESPGSGKADFAYNDTIQVTLQWVLSEWKTDDPNAVPFKGKSRELFRVNMIGSYHGVQEIAFNPLAKKGDKDYGLLYIGIGDGAGVEFGYPFIVRSKNKIWGSIIRIDPMGKNSKNGNYGIPDSNPYAKDPDTNTVREIYANGFRNPHRITWTKAGQILASNIGHHNVESLYMVLPGHDYGWPIREGKFLMKPEENMSLVFALPPDDSIYHITYPVAQYDHDEGNAISGGFEYWGKALPELQGKCIFGDIVKGRLFFVEMKDLKIGSQATIKEMKVSLNGSVTTLVKMCGADKVDVRFGRDHTGELYVMTKPDGKVYKVVSATSKAL
jgi:glucose/arabinose dehydrogenase/mono/diheme cytochrome c family protein